MRRPGPPRSGWLSALPSSLDDLRGPSVAQGTRLRLAGEQPPGRPGRRCGPPARRARTLARPPSASTPSTAVRTASSSSASRSRFDANASPRLRIELSRRSRSVRSSSRRRSSSEAIWLNSPPSAANSSRPWIGTFALKSPLPQAPRGFEERPDLGLQRAREQHRADRGEDEEAGQHDRREQAAARDVGLDRVEIREDRHAHRLVAEAGGRRTRRRGRARRRPTHAADARAAARRARPGGWWPACGRRCGPRCGARRGAGRCARRRPRCGRRPRSRRTSRRPSPGATERTGAVASCGAHVDPLAAAVGDADPRGADARAGARAARAPRGAVVARAQRRGQAPVAADGRDELGRLLAVLAVQVDRGLLPRGQAARRPCRPRCRR